MTNHHFVFKICQPLSYSLALVLVKMVLVKFKGSMLYKIAKKKKTICDYSMSIMVQKLGKSIFVSVQTCVGALFDSNKAPVLPES